MLSLTTFICSITGHEIMNRKEWKINGWISVIANQAYSTMLPAGLFLNKKLLLVRGYIMICYFSIISTLQFYQIALIFFHIKYHATGQRTCQGSGWQVWGLPLAFSKIERFFIKKLCLWRHINFFIGIAAESCSTHFRRCPSHGNVRGERA